MKRILIASLLTLSSLSFAGEKSYNLSLSDTKGFAGEVIEAGTTVHFTNNSDQTLRLIADSNLPEGRRVVLPTGAEMFVKEIAAGQSAAVNFSVTGYYNLALAFADGTLSKGEFAVIGDEIVNVKIIGISFNPKSLTVKPGTWVRWINTSRMSHTVTTDKTLAANPDNAAVPAGAAAWHSGTIAAGKVFMRQLNVEGDYKYFCKPHERMGHTGQITVSSH